MFTPISNPRADHSGVRHLVGPLCLLSLLCIGCEDDMSAQPRFDPLEASTLFADGRSARPPIAGTIHRDEPLDPVLNSGIRDGHLIATPPLPITRELLLRGQDRYGILCTPCHSPIGDGDGMVVRRGLHRPPSFHDPRLQQAPLGYFFAVISDGLASMPSYSAMLTPADRWAVAAYIRVLQYSQHAPISDVSAQERQKLEQTP